MQAQEMRSPKTLLESSTRMVHAIADLLDDAAETSKFDFHTQRLRRLSEGFRSLDGPLTKIAGHLEW
jgi:hypothetical protein